MPVINTCATRAPSPNPDSPDSIQLIGTITGDFDFAKELQDYEDCTKTLSLGQDMPRDPKDNELALVSLTDTTPLLNPAGDLRISLSNIDGEFAQIVNET